MCDCKELEQEVDFEESEEVIGTLDSEEILGLIAVQEEEKRIEIFDNFEILNEELELVSDEAKNEIADIIYMVGKLRDIGVDYNNNLALVNNFLTNRANRNITKLQSVQVQQNQI